MVVGPHPPLAHHHSRNPATARGNGRGTREIAAAAAAQMGLTPTSAHSSEDRYAAQRDAVIAQTALSRSARLAPPCFAETSRERAAEERCGAGCPTAMTR